MLVFYRKMIVILSFFTYMKLQNKSTIYINNNGFFVSADEISRFCALYVQGLLKQIHKSAFGAVNKELY